MVAREKQDVGRVVVEFTLTNNEDTVLVRRGHLLPEQVRRVQLKGVVDTGAAMLVLPESAARQLGLPKSGEANVRYADHRTATREIVSDAEVAILGRTNVFTAIVEPGRTDALIGAIVLEALDMLVDCQNQTLHPRDPERPFYEIE